MNVTQSDNMAPPHTKKGGNRDADSQGLDVTERMNVHERKKGQTKAMTGQETLTLTLTSRLLLSVELMGAEANTTFEQLYTLPNLQKLGVPLSLVFITGVISGPTSCLLVPLLGCFSDRGSNPAHRRMWTLVLSAGLLVTGMLMVISANLIHLRYYVTRSNHTSEIVVSMTSTAGVKTNEADWLKSHLHRTFNQSDSKLVSKEAESLFLSTIETAAAPNQVNLNAFSIATATSTTSSVSPTVLTAELGLVGYALLDVGYDSVSATTKTWMLMCTPKTQHAAALVAGLVMTSLGGILSSALGVVDLASVFGLSSSSDSGLEIQTSIQAVIMVVVVMTGLLCSVLEGRKQLRHQGSQQPQDTVVTLHDQDTLPTVAPSNDAIIDRQQPTASHNDKEPPFHENHSSADSTLRAKRDALGSSHRSPPSSPRLRKEFPEADSTTRYGALNNNKTPAENGDLNFCSTDPRRRLIADKSGRAPTRRCGRWGVKTTVGLLCGSTYFAVAVITLYVMTSSDFVGKTVYHGDPAAPVGSDSLARYEKGVRTASYGFLVYYVMNLLFSFIQQRVLNVLGYTLEFVSTQLLMSVCLVVLTTTATVETFFLASAMAGIHRAVYHVVPYSVISDVIHDEANKPGEDKRPRLGLAMSMVTIMMPLAFGTLYPWVGAVEDMTGVVAVPLWLTAAYACLSALLFLLMRL